MDPVHGALNVSVAAVLRKFVASNTLAWYPTQDVIPLSAVHPVRSSLASALWLIVVLRTDLVNIQMILTMYFVTIA